MDIYLGGLLLATGMLHVIFPDWSGSTVQRLGLWFGVGMPGYLLMVVGKKYITAPRMGRVKLGPAGKARRRKTNIMMIVFFLLTVAAVVITAVGLGGPHIERSAFAVPIGVAIFLIILFSLLAYFLAYDRLYLIGLAFALPWPVIEFVQQSAAVDISAAAFLVSSGIVISVGLVTFVRFIRENPLPAEPDPTADR